VIAPNQRRLGATAVKRRGRRAEREPDNRGGEVMMGVSVRRSRTISALPARGKARHRRRASRQCVGNVRLMTFTVATASSMRPRRAERATRALRPEYGIA